MEIKIGQNYAHKSGKITVKILEEAKTPVMLFNEERFFFVRSTKDPEEKPWPLDNSQLAKFYELVTLDKKLDSILGK